MVNQQNSLIFRSGEKPLKMASNRCKIINMTIVKGTSIDDFTLIVVSYIGGVVRSEIPIKFSTLDDITYLDAERKIAKICIKLDFTDKKNIELVLIPTFNETDYEVRLDFVIFPSVESYFMDGTNVTKNID